MSEIADARLRELSRHVFNQTHRLHVMLAIAESPDGLVTQTELAKFLGISVSNVQNSVRDLAACGLLTELPRGESRSRFFMRNDSHAWAWAKEMKYAAALEELSFPESVTR